MNADDKQTFGKPGSSAAVDAVLVYATFPTMAVAEAVAADIVSEGLAACANILPALVSIYIWEGRLQREQEVAVVMKTRRTLAERMVARVKGLHPYANPAILVLPVTGGSADFLDWIRQQTVPPQG